MIAAAPRIVAVIQARMGSSRFPGKVLRDVAGKPLLWHVVERLKRSRRISAIAIATSTAPRDDAIQTFAEKHGVTAIRGPEDNVLARFAMAAEAMDADVIVRVSADAPFIDADFIDHLVDALIAQDGDYVLLEDGAVTAHEGVDPFSRRALDKLMMDAAGDPVAREHVTGYFKLHPDFVHIVRAAPYPLLAVECGRLTIDTPDDLAFIEAIHDKLGMAPGAVALGDVVRLLGREPLLRNLNAHVQQKPIARAAARVLIRCDGGGAYGYGHVKRMLSLARAARPRRFWRAIRAERYGGCAGNHPPCGFSGRNNRLARRCAGIGRASGRKPKRRSGMRSARRAVPPRTGAVGTACAGDRGGG
jgi:spore coat polysaccharide biosynthesis protein SpsF